MNLDRSSTIRFEARRIFFLRNAALDAARKALIQPEGGRSRVFSDGERLMATIEQLDSCRTIMEGRGLSSQRDQLIDEAIWMGLDRIATDLEEQTALLRQEFDDELANASPAEGERMKTALTALEVALATDGPTRADHISIAFASFQEHLRLNHGIGAAGMWLRMGWLLWKMGDDPVVAQRAVHEASRLSGRSKTITSWIAHRLLAQMQVEDGEIEAAHKTILQALQIRQDAQTSLEAAAIAANANKIRETRTLLVHALTEQPILLVPTLVLEVNAEWVGDVLATVAEVQPKLTDAARGLLSQWEATSKRVVDACSTIGRGDLVSQSLLDEHRTLSRTLAKADIFVAWFVNRTSESSRKVLVEQARQSINREIKRCEELLREAEQKIAAAEAIRDQQLGHIQRVRDTEAAKARSEVRRAMKYESALDQGCGLSMGFAVVGFAIFAVMAALGVIRGFAFGIETNGGKIALLMSVLPMAFFLFAQIGQAVARARIENAIKQKVDVIDKQYRKDAGAIDQRYREDMEQSRAMLDDRGRELRICREGLRIVGGGTRQNSKAVAQAA